jgi:hypothetical protein
MPERPPTPPKGIKDFGVTATAIIFRDGKILLLRRNPNDEILPGLWTVPGGRMKSDDFVDMPRTTFDAWYGISVTPNVQKVRKKPPSFCPRIYARDRFYTRG